jgi:hypothetical protein
MISKDNKSFCAVPFVSTMVNTDTTIRYCCMVKGKLNNNLKKPDGGILHLSKMTSFNEAWNSRRTSSLFSIGNMIDGNTNRGL